MKKIQLTRGFEAIVDNIDFKRMNKYSWHYQPKRNTGYAIGLLRVNGKNSTRRMHRMILGAKAGEQIDHINGNGLDNRRINLRIATARDNAINRRTKPKSGFKGVRLMYTSKKGREVYIATIGPRTKHIVIGYFSSSVKAAKAYNIEAKKLYGKFAVLNIVRKK